MKRREFLAQGAAAMPAAAVPFLQAAPQVGATRGIKIADIKTFLVGAGGRNLH